MTKALFVLVPVLALGIVGAVVSLRAHESDPAFLFSQQHPGEAKPASVARTVKIPNEPVPPGTRSSKAASASCRPRGSGDLRNPWSCTVHYRSGNVVRYSVELAPGGRARGVDPTGTLRIQGCCVDGI